jgi:hypothetical protein
MRPSQPIGAALPMSLPAEFLKSMLKDLQR